LTEGINRKFYFDNKVSPFSRERFSRRDSFGKREFIVTKHPEKIQST
jgi:hypothetical protein